MATVTFERVTKLYGDIPAVADLSLQVSDGEFLVLVGPSGCGKTTSLRMLAGFETPSYGAVWIGKRLVNRVRPKDRNVAMVFQNYALYPHMSVFGNLAFGMRIRREPRGDIRQRVNDVAELLEIGELLQRRPGELSGGQRQRVALGRALLRRPDVFLMDEPLSNLDAALRLQMRAELSRLHERLGITTVYVTHDQTEAMTMGSRIAVMADGRLQQVDSPERVYARPANLFVAGFIGSPRMNFATGRIVGESDVCRIGVYGREIPVPAAMARAVLNAGLREVVVGIRPEDVGWTLEATPDCDVRFPARVEVVEPLGSETYVIADCAGTAITARLRPRAGVRPGEQIDLAFSSAHIHAFDPASGESLGGAGAVTAVAPRDASPTELGSTAGMPH